MRDLDLRKWARIFGWAVAYYVGGGLLFVLISAFFLLAPQIVSAEVYLPLIIGFPLLFAFVAVYHGCTGNWAFANEYLRQSSLMVLWVIAFYFGFIVLVLLVAAGAPPEWDAFLLTLVIFSPLAGGWAGSLCWRGKLPGTRKEQEPEEPPADSSDTD